MDTDSLKEKLIEVLGQIQADSGLECPPLTAETKPLEALPEFDSKVWPVATSILSTEIGVTIPYDMNIFVDEKTQRPLTIDEITASVCQFLERQSENEKAVA